MKPGDHPEFFRFPAPPGQSRESTLRLDRDGHFWHDGERVEHPKLLDALHSWISWHPDNGRFILTNGYDWTYFTVDDAPFQVRSVLLDEPGPRLRLSSGREVPFGPLSLAPDGSLYTSLVLDGHPCEARFSRHAQTQLDPLLEEHDGLVGVRVAGTLLIPTERPS
jgi:hypothetical protein